MALALLRFVTFKLNQNKVYYTIDQLHALLDQMRITKVKHVDKCTYVLLEDPPPGLAQIYQILGIKWRHKFTQEAWSLWLENHNLLIFNAFFNSRSEVEK